jgi:hypothetical protein
MRIVSIADGLLDEAHYYTEKSQRDAPRRTVEASVAVKRRFPVDKREIPACSG